MLTADLVDARKKNGQLVLRPLDRESRDDAVALASELLETARAMIGSRREDVEDEWQAASSGAKHFKLAAGLRKLVADACTFEAAPAVDPVELRRVLFGHASERRAAGTFDRAAALDFAGAALGLPAGDVDRALFADLRAEHVLREAPIASAESLVEAWELGQAQAVLLTAVKIACDIESASPGPLRAFLAKLKFHKLLFAVERRDAGFRVIIDGPFSMFDSVTKYGLRLALMLPALRELERWQLAAEIRWGKTREPLVFQLAASGPPVKSDELHVSDDVVELAEGINTQAGWKARPATELFDVPGLGVCIPDLELTHRRKKVYVEVLGYWSRDAVFRRVELVERGLGARIVFAISSRLRVSREVLDASLPASLYVYKGKMSPKAVVTHAAKLLAP